MFTLESLVANASLRLKVLLPGPEGAMDEPVAWVHNTELPDPSAYVRERELVLTNGLWAGQVSAARFVAGVRRARAAGIVFGLRAETPVTPPDLVDACRDAGLPLLEIAPEVPFTAISQAVSALYADQRRESLAGTVRRGDALATAISRGAGVSGVLAVLRRDHDLPLAVVDRMGRTLAAAGTELDDAQARTVAAGLARRPPALELDLGGVTAALFLVGAVGDVDAALVCLRPLSTLGAAEREALEQAGRFLSLEVAKQQAVQAIEMRFAGELLDMVLSGGTRAGEVAGRLRAFGVDPSEPLAVCALTFTDPHPATPPGPVGGRGEVASTGLAGEQGPVASTGLAEAVGDFFGGAGIPAVVIGGTHDVVVVFAWRDADSELPPLAQRLLAAVERRFPGRRAVAGLGGVAPYAARLRQPLLHAREACRVLRRSRTGPVVRSFAELGTHRLLLGLVDQETLHGFAHDLLTPLRDHDARRGGDLERTLRAFLDHDGHWADTAAALHVHVNTLRNRLTKVADLTGRDVGRTEDRVDMFLALAIDAMD
ncbi:PucR C-terminal helix-turn-helix domain-containing protein [Nonomuraea solani]|uniref:PucR C-terminal helix-turn-helix domain-containing protein n=1 Tax=Nonomuraea solani TaxID=1144553 RepID=A0A1H6EW59_9ACTN|nr:PucR family transcriptional regulator ligand-binding domain-containing protein [Nonomuraea solani]SEH01155.1 PucR C-terminal helix-turn-helix domain-containing protein [Nonomuraea solani]